MFKSNIYQFLCCCFLWPLSDSYKLLSREPLILVIPLPAHLRLSCRPKTSIPQTLLKWGRPSLHLILPHSHPAPPHLHFLDNSSPVPRLFQHNCLGLLRPLFATREKARVAVGGQQGPKPNTASVLCVSAVCAQIRKIEGLIIQTLDGGKPTASQDIGNSLRSEWPGQIHSRHPETWASTEGSHSSLLSLISVCQLSHKWDASEWGTHPGD